MNHADRERLSQLLDTIETMGVGPKAKAALAEARTIVDQPTGYLKYTGPPLTPEEAETLKTKFSKGGIDPTPYYIPIDDTAPKETLFWSEPVHEFDPRRPGAHRARHRAPNPLTLIISLTVAAIVLIGLTAATGPNPGPRYQPNPNMTHRGPSWPSQTGFAPYLPGHQPGTPGNGLGVTAP